MTVVMAEEGADRGAGLEFSTAAFGGAVAVAWVAPHAAAAPQSIVVSVALIFEFMRTSSSALKMGRGHGPINCLRGSTHVTLGHE
jgi:hypothetical protein